MAKFYAQATRDFTRTIHMGPLVITGLKTGNETDIAQGHTAVLHTKAGQNFVFRTKKRRDQYIAACNAENPGCVAPVQPFDRIAASEG